MDCAAGSSQDRLQKRLCVAIGFTDHAEPRMYEHNTQGRTDDTEHDGKQLTTGHSPRCTGILASVDTAMRTRC